jgi:hypothetical protein
VSEADSSGQPDFRASRENKRRDETVVLNSEALADMVGQAKGEGRADTGPPSSAETAPPAPTGTPSAAAAGPPAASPTPSAARGGPNLTVVVAGIVAVVVVVVIVLLLVL